MAFISPRLEKKILRSFGRASIDSSWWKQKTAEIKFCLRCGGPLFWRLVEAEGCNRFVCRDCRYIAYQNPKPIAATLPVRNGRIYLLKRDIEPSRGLWTYPAGHMELGETVEEAAMRETREEIRCRVDLLGLHGIYSYPDSGAVTIVYNARVLGPEPRTGHEAQCVRAFAPEDIPWEELAFRSTFQALREWASVSERVMSGGKKRPARGARTIP